MNVFDIIYIDLIKYIVYNTSMTFIEFKNRLEELDLDTKKFSHITNIPFSTIINWSAKRNKNQLPSSAKWVKPFLDLYEQNKKNKYIINYLEEKINEK